MKIGDKSGCLEVIGSCNEVENDLQETIAKWAEEEWNKFSDWERWDKYGYEQMSFKSYYELDEEEAKLFDTKKKMPETFLGKFRKKGDCFKIFSDSHFLWHKRKPSTREALEAAYRNKMLYKVRCTVCNRIFYMDSESFHCVKRENCMGASCLAYKVNEQGADYKKSLYEWKPDKAEIQALDYQISNVSELGNALTYYGLGKDMSIAYISDIHLLHHMKQYDNNERKMIHSIVNQLYQSMKQSNIILFGGDISSNKHTTMDFYTYFMRKYDFQIYKKFKMLLYYLKDIKRLWKSSETKCLELKYEKNLYKISKEIITKEMLLSEFFNFSAFKRYRSAHHSQKTYEEAFSFYKMTKCYDKMNISEDIEEQIFPVIKMLDIQEKSKVRYEKYKRKQSIDLDEIHLFEKEHSKLLENIFLLDYPHARLREVYAVLGNHEYIDFPDIKSCVSYYEEELSRLGITLLHNTYQVNDKYLIYGGTGFAKYEPKWNADNIRCYLGFSKEIEGKETTLFENGYKNAIKYAKEKKLCFLCISHYQISACLNGRFDKEAIYFTGHNHKNEYAKTLDKVLYADNQIGYKNNNFSFKIATTGYEINPYRLLDDGLYQTTIGDYLRFYRYIGESVGDGKGLHHICKDGKASVYVLKRKDYYGFFLLNLSGKSKGISIINGGKTKKITGSTDMAWLCNNFDVVLTKYICSLMPLRKAQEQLSKELKELGFYGEIHGCIVDIDKFHHIMLNPFDGSMIFYYSPEYGELLLLDSFEDIISDNDILLSKFREKSEKSDYLLGRPLKNYLFKTEKMHDKAKVYQMNKEEKMIYKLSEKINSLQRIFSGHVLREFDLKLTESEQQPYRKYLYTNYLLMYEGIEYKIVEDNGGDVIVAEVVHVDSENKELILTGTTKKIAVFELKRRIRNQADRDTYWIKKG